MQPIDIVERVKATYKSYIKTAFPIIDDDLRMQMYDLIEQANLLWRGPYLSLQRPYEFAEKKLAEQHERGTLGKGDAGKKVRKSKRGRPKDLKFLEVLRKA